MAIFRKSSAAGDEKAEKFSFSDVTAPSASSTLSNGTATTKSAGTGVRTSGSARRRARDALRRWRFPRLVSLRKLRQMYADTAPEANMWEKVDFNEPGLSKANLRFGQSQPQPRRPHPFQDRQMDMEIVQRTQVKQVDSELSFSTAASLAPFFGNFSGAGEERRRARQRAQYLVTAEAYIFAADNE